MKQVVVIHGGTTFSDYDNYLQSLTTKTLHTERFIYKPMWKELLQEKLGDAYQVLLPAMPNKTNARYEEWALWFRHLTDIIEDDVILIGHSLGAIFLAKYLSDNEFPHIIKATILVAAPYDDDTDEDLGDFRIESINHQLSNQAGRLVFFAGNDDPVISNSEILKYQTMLPDAEFHIVSAPDHFVRQDFPELTNLLKQL